MARSLSAQAMRKRLLAWYDGAARDLPWRRTRDPYAIWVSEIMLQQTRVDTVVRYYDRFIAKFPSATALARAAEDDVMAAWSGLGYYRRARLLHAGVREVVARYAGEVPSDAQARRALPGVGRYTAGAIGSIAFDKQEPIVDGNVARVLCRVHAIDTPPEARETQAQLWQRAEELVIGERPGALNQALMELGATVCTKAQPRCGHCPIEDGCRAHALGREQLLPIAKTRKAPKPWPLVAIVATRAKRGGGEVLLERGGGTLFGGLWNVPMADGQGHATAHALSEGLGVALSSTAPLGTVRHVLSHRAISLEVWAARSKPPKAPKSSGRGAKLVALDELPSVGTSQLTRKALALAELIPSASLRVPEGGDVG